MEDNRADIFLIKHALRAYHISDDPIVMEDGEAGYDFIQDVEEGRTPPPDLFILDLSLPRRNGPELLERIKRSHLCADVKVLIASSSHNPKDQFDAAQRGADRYFVKPSSFSDFMEIGNIVWDLLNR